MMRVPITDGQASERTETVRDRSVACRASDVRSGVPGPRDELICHARLPLRGVPRRGLENR